MHTTLQLQDLPCWLHQYGRNTNLATGPIKARKKRDRQNCKPIINKDLVKEMLKLAAGATPTGRNCFKILWLYTGPSETDNNDLQYCTPACLRSRRRREKDLHINKLHIIQLCLEEKYNLIHTDIYQEPRLGGASLLKQLQTFANKGFKSKIKTVTPGKVLGGTS